MNVVREIHVNKATYWNGIGIPPTLDLAVAKKHFKSSGFKIGIPLGVYDLVAYDSEIALLEPLHVAHPHWAKFFWVTSIRNLIPDRQIYSSALPISIGCQTNDRPHVHPDAPMPEAKLWRYMPLDKFEKMLVQRGIFLSRADKFPDPLEGTISVANKILRDEVYRDDPKMARAFSQFSNALADMKKWTYVSCWRVDEHESPMCWSKYNADVAIQTTYRKIAHYTQCVFCSGVRYVDFKDTWVFEGSSLMPFTHKDREQFEWEQEFRIIMQDFPKKDPAFDQTEFYECEKQNPKIGIVLQVDLLTFIEQISIAPNAGEESRQRIETLALEHGLNYPKRSQS